jgi:hypothetical protein
MQDAEIVVVDFENQIVAEFNPLIVDIPKLVEESRGLKINGLDDEVGYKAVYDAIQKFKSARGNLTRFAKERRDEFTAKNRKIREIEKEYLEMIAKVEDDLVEQRRVVDEAKKREERRILLPGRVEMLKTIEVAMTDDDLLDMDEKHFTTFFNESKTAFLERKEAERLTKEAEEKRSQEIKEAEERATARAKEEAEAKAKAEAERVEIEKKEAEARAEREKQEAIEKVKREAEEKEHARVEAERKAKEEADRIEQEKEAERIKAEKNKKYQEWVKTLPEGVEIKREGDTFVAWQKVGEITIK